MILYEVLWNNNLAYEDHMERSKVYSSLEKAKAEYNREQYRDSMSYADETLTLSSFDEDDATQTRFKIAERHLPSGPVEDFEWFSDNY